MKLMNYATCFTLSLLVMSVIGCQKSKYRIVHETPPPVVITQPPADCPVTPAPPVHEVECKDNKGKVVLRLYVHNLLDIKISKDLCCTKK